MITLHYVDKHYERPPVVRVEFDVTLHNPGDVPRWFLLPTHAGKSDTFRASELSLWALTNDAGESLKIGRLRGTHGCFVLLLAAGVTITLHKLPIRWRGNLPEHLTVTAYVADEVLLDSESLISWFEDVPVNAHDIEIDVQTVADDSQVKYAKYTPDLSEKTLILTHADTLTIETTL